MMNSAPQYCNLIILVDLLLLGVLGACNQFLRAAWFYSSTLLCFYAYFISIPFGPLAPGTLSTYTHTSTSTHIAKMPVKTARRCWIPMRTIGKLVAGGGSSVIQEVTPPPSFNPSFAPLFQPLYLSHQLSHPHHQTTSHYHRQNNHHNHRHHHHFTSNSSPTSPRNPQLSQFKITFHFIVSFSVS